MRSAECEVRSAESGKCGVCLRVKKDLTRNKNIVLKKAGKGTDTVIINRQDKIKVSQSLLDDRSNYRPLVEPMVESTSQNGQQLVKSLSQEGHIDSMTEKWLSLTPNPPRTPVFLHTYKDSYSHSSRLTYHIMM